MNILHVLESLSASSGGIASAVSHLAESQRAAGLSVEILTTNCDLDGRSYEEPGTRINEAGVVTTYCAVDFKPLRASRSMATWLANNAGRFDLFHVHGLYRFPPSYASYFARRHGKPYVMSPHGALDPYLFARSSKSVFLKRIYERFVDIPNLRHASAIHYTADEERARTGFLKLPTSTFVVPNGLELNSYTDLPSRGALRQRYNLGDAPVLLFLGRLHPKKGLDILIEAFARIREQRKDVHLLIAGPDQAGQAAQIRLWAQELGLDDAVTLTGPLFGRDVIQAYVDSDVFVLPSYTENFGMTVVEAMASGLPVIISDQVNIFQEIANARAGLVTACDARQVADAVILLLNNKELCSVQARNARDLVRARFGQDSVVEQFSAHYESVLAAHGRANGSKSARGSLK